MAFEIGTTIAEGLLQEVDEAIEVERRLEHRVAGYFAVLIGNDYLYVRSCTKPDDMPVPPCPDHVSKTSKRTWEASIKTWRRELKQMRNFIELSDSCCRCVTSTNMLTRVHITA